MRAVLSTRLDNRRRIQMVRTNAIDNQTRPFRQCVEVIQVHLHNQDFCQHQYRYTIGYTVQEAVDTWIRPIVTQLSPFVYEALDLRVRATCDGPFESGWETFVDVFCCVLACVACWAQQDQIEFSRHFVKNELSIFRYKYQYRRIM